MTSKAWLMGGLAFQASGWGDVGRTLGDDCGEATLSPEISRWSIRSIRTPDAPDTDLRVEDREVLVNTSSFSHPREAFLGGVSLALLHANRIPVHAALLSVRSGGEGILIIGSSGAGKSSLTWLALVNGGDVVSDDLVAIRTLPAGESAGSSLRKRLRVPTHLLDLQTRANGRIMPSAAGLPRIRIDPDRLRRGCFVPEKTIGSLVFLERGVQRSLRPLSRPEALERLLTTCAPALLTMKPRPLFEVLVALVNRVRAKEARLTDDCLRDAHVLEELAA